MRVCVLGGGCYEVCNVYTGHFLNSCSLFEIVHVPLESVPVREKIKMRIKSSHINSFCFSSLLSSPGIK